MGDSKGENTQFRFVIYLLPRNVNFFTLYFSKTYLFIWKTEKRNKLQGLLSPSIPRFIPQMLTNRWVCFRLKPGARKFIWFSHIGSGDPHTQGHHRLPSKHNSWKSERVVMTWTKHAHVKIRHLKHMVMRLYHQACPYIF